MDPRDALLLDGFRARFSDLQDMPGRTMFKTIAQLDQDEIPELELTTRERIAPIDKGETRASRRRELAGYPGGAEQLRARVS
jgi:hypothetical protein